MNIGKKLLEALSSDEIANILHEIFSQNALDEFNLSSITPSTKKIIENAIKGQEKLAFSLAKKEFLWQEALLQWNEILYEATDDEGKYIEQDVDWEPPYFSETTLVDDLEKIAKRLLPLCELAIEQDFSPRFEPLQDLERTMNSLDDTLPEWIYHDNALILEKSLTSCILILDYKISKNTQQSIIDFAQYVRDYAKKNTSIELSEETLHSFFTSLPENATSQLYIALQQRKKEQAWLSELNNASSVWHDIFLDLAEKYNPIQAFQISRNSISQNWLYSLPVLEHLLKEDKLEEASNVVTIALRSMLPDGWDPKKELFFKPKSHQRDVTPNHKTLFTYCQTIAERQGKQDCSQVWMVQIFALSHFDYWEKMLQNFQQHEAPESLRQYWLQTILKTNSIYYAQSVRKIDWVEWLLLEIIDNSTSQEHSFQQKLNLWLKKIKMQGFSHQSDFVGLALLTSDIQNSLFKNIALLPSSFEKIISSVLQGERGSIQSRRKALQNKLEPEIFSLIMNCWSTQFHSLIPDPKQAKNSNYWNHAKWMQALQEINPTAYQQKSSEWKISHKRRSNLWREFQKHGLQI